MGTKITFLGAAGTVTGSKYLVESGGKRILIDAGLFQGERSWQERNWDAPPIDLGSVDATLLTHAHIDHIGLLPRYVKLGLKSPVYATPSTVALGKILLRDSAYLQEEDAEYRARKRERSRFDPPLPLYTRADAELAISQLNTVQFHREVQILPGVTAQWYWAGHIIGAASIVLSIGGRRIAFSGDIGRYDVPILRNPETPPMGDLLLIESTYGDRLHPPASPRELFGKIVRETTSRGGVVVIPSFAVGRCQELLYLLRELKERKEIPDVPVIVDSPMAFDATELYTQASAEYDEEAMAILQRGAKPFVLPKLYFTKDREESVKLNSIDEPMVIIAASGMLTGGRILHHIKHRISSPLNTIMFVGFQPKGGRGALIASGAKTMRLFGLEIPIRARIEQLSSLSAHADLNDLMRWCRAASEKPGAVAVVHGEAEVAEKFSGTLNRELGWSAKVAEYQEQRDV
jgi:metallo-beta-lactamase family protein